MNTPHRRDILKAAAAAATLPVGRTVARSSTEQRVSVLFGDPERVDEVRTARSTVSSSADSEVKIGEITGTGGPVGIDGSYTSDVYLTDSSRFEYTLWRGVATIGPSGDDRGKIWLSDSFRTVTARLLAHERGHNLGFEHTGGFMLPENPDMCPDADLHEESAETARHTDGLSLYDWRGSSATAHLREVIDEWRADAVSTADLRYAIDRWRNGESRDIYADRTFVENLSGELDEYDGADRRIRSAAIYQPDHGDRYDVWESRDTCSCVTVDCELS